MADDTGLEVDALGGAPGVYSARYAGEDVTYADNVAKLLSELDALPDDGGERTARFRTVALVAFPDGTELWAEGVVDGTIAREAQGSAGFGYDPVFVPAEGGGRTFAEMTAGGQARHFAPGEGVPRPGGCTGRTLRPLSRCVRADQEASVAPLARAARIIWTPLVNESLMSRSLSLEMKSCTRFSSSSRMMGLKAR